MRLRGTALFIEGVERGLVAAITPIVVPTKSLLVVFPIELIVIKSSQKINPFVHHHLDIAVFK